VRRFATLLGMTAVVVLTAAAAQAVVVPGGGSKASDCMSVFDVPAANSPPPPRVAKNVDCVDGDSTCDADGVANGRCAFPLQVCLDATTVPGCTPDRVDSLTVDHAQDNGDPRFDTDFQALQARIDQLVPTTSQDDCTVSSTITVPLKSSRSGVFRKGTKKLSLLAAGFTTTGNPDRDHMTFTCRPANGGVYTPRELYDGTFDRIAQQVFAPTCAVSGCHDSNTHQNNMILLPNTAYSQIVGVTPTNVIAAGDGIFRIDAAGDPQKSLLYLKVTGMLPSGYGVRMPYHRPAIASNLQDIIRLWIIGDGTTGPAPQTGWVTGTDQ